MAFARLAKACRRMRRRTFDAAGRSIFGVLLPFPRSGQTAVFRVSVSNFAACFTCSGLLAALALPLSLLCFPGLLFSLLGIP